MDRKHTEQTIQQHDPRELEDVIATIAFREGLSWFTADQLEEIRDEVLNRLAKHERPAA